MVRAFGPTRYPPPGLADTAVVTFESRGAKPEVFDAQGDGLNVKVEAAVEFSDRPPGVACLQIPYQHIAQVHLGHTGSFVRRLIDAARSDRFHDGVIDAGAQQFAADTGMNAVAVERAVAVPVIAKLPQLGVQECLPVGFWVGFGFSVRTSSFSAFKEDFDAAVDRTIPLRRTND